MNQGTAARFYSCNSLKSKSLSFVCENNYCGKTCLRWGDRTSWENNSQFTPPLPRDFYNYQCLSDFKYESVKCYLLLHVIHSNLRLVTTETVILCKDRNRSFQLEKVTKMNIQSFTTLYYFHLQKVTFINQNFSLFLAVWIFSSFFHIMAHPEFQIFVKLKDNLRLRLGVTRKFAKT